MAEKKEISITAEKLQREYIEKHGEVGKVIAKSKAECKNRYALHKKLTPYFNIYAMRKTLYKIKDYPDKIQKSVDELINEYGYVIQSKIE